MRFKTVSGSDYEIVKHPAGTVIRRTNTASGKRGDGEWVRLHNDPDIVVGASATLILDSLAELGYDDIGTPEEWASGYTTRVTSMVTEVYSE